MCLVVAVVVVHASWYVDKVVLVGAKGALVVVLVGAKGVPVVAVVAVVLVVVVRVMAVLVVVVRVMAVLVVAAVIQAVMVVLVVTQVAKEHASLVVRRIVLKAVVIPVQTNVLVRRHLS